MWYVDEDNEKFVTNPEEEEEEEEEDVGDEEEEEGDDGSEQDDGKDSSRNNKPDKKKKDDENEGEKDGEKDREKGEDGKKDPDSKDGDAKKKDNLEPDKVKDDLKNASDELDKAKSGGEGTPGETSASPTGDPASTAGEMGGSGSSASATGGTAAQTGGGATAGTSGTVATAGVEGSAAAAGVEGTAAATTGTVGGTAVATGGTAVAAGGAGAGAAGAGAVATAATPIGWVLLIILIIIILIIIIVGVVCFFIYMPGQVVEKIKNLGIAFLDKVQAVVEGKENVVHGEEVADIANYLERMGYDLKGEGFVTADITGYLESAQPANSYHDAEQGVYRSNDSGEVLSIYSDPIKTYIVSDNLCYLVKNANFNLEAASAEHPILTLATVVTTILGFLISPVVGLSVLFSYVVINGGNPTWGSGLISIYHEGGMIGKKGDFYRDIETGYIELDVSTKQLKIKRGWTNNAYSFDVDGWSGRYGMPLEFLLSIHIATQMPDLAMDIATSFDTDVQVLLHPVDSGEIQAGYHIGPGDSSDSDFVTWDDIMSVVQSQQSGFSGLWNSMSNWLNDHTSWWDSSDSQLYTIQAQEYIQLFQMGLPHAEGCGCCADIPGSYSDDDACEEEGNLDPTSEDFDIADHIISDSCKQEIMWIIAALQEIEDKNWYSYTPYIAQVTDHWFRDVYFVIEDIDNTGVVMNDEDYFYETNERWSIYETYQEGDEIPLGFEVGDYKLYEYNSETDTYTLSKATKDEIDKRNEQIINGDTSVSRLVKKAVTKKLTEIVDDEGNSTISGIDGNRWTAYGTEDTSINWQKLEITEDTAEILTRYEDKLYYKESRPNDIKQIEDGQRAATNPTIKEMFIDNKYYRYDGTVKKADLIAEDRKINNSSEADTAKNNTAQDKRNEKLLGKVSITKDSLTAFSMLENTHTLDADYVYKDFKELIVELDYFDKEELSDKISEVMTWILPDTGSSGWPIRKYEKGEIFYGTLINSKIDLLYMKKKDIEEAELTLESLKNEVDESGTSGTASGTATGSVAEMVTKGYEIHKIMEDNGYDYCVLRPSDGCDHSRFGHSCALKESIEEAESSNNTRNTCCATYVSWILNEVGFGFVSHGAKNTYDWCKDNGWTAITDYSSLQPGDLLFNKAGYSGTDTSNIGHVQMLGNDGEWLNAGSTNAINSEPNAYEANFIIGMRSTLNGSAAPFEGYDPDEPVVAPITGKVIEYGEVQRTNIETGEDETVEFIKIEAINKYVYDTDNQGRGYLECKGADDANTFENKASDAAKTLEGYDYFYNEYSGILEGYVLYIEGFDLTLYDDDGAKALVESGDTDSADVTRYTGNTVYNMTDDLEEARSWWKEDAKTSAIPLIEINGELYIKEGTVIGKTYEDQEVNETGAETLKAGNGNYIRLILRNLDDSIVEDVESYFNITDSYTFNGSVGNIQNIESADPTLMTLIEQLAGPLEGEYPGIVNILKAISMNESGGGTNPAAGDDPMQAVESTGGNAGDSIGGWENSVKAGINALTASWDKAKGYGINDLRVVIQAYNYGPGFVDYVHNSGANAYTKDLASSFSDQQAEKLGWSGYGDKNYVDPKIYKYLPDLNV